MFDRHIRQWVLAAWQHAPVLLLQGARQCGKTTLVQNMAAQLNASYITLDDAGMLAAASTDAQTFVTTLDLPVIIDEVQLVPEIFRAVKLVVDRKRKPGLFLLTGSANVMLLPRLSESLVGRTEIIRLWPLSQGEISAVRETFIDQVFDADWRQQTLSQCDNQSELIARILRGGYPQPVQTARREWFGSYITTILQRDIRELANIDRLTTFPDLMSILAARVSGLLNVSDLSIASGVPNTTLTRYLSLLEGAFQILRLRPWSKRTEKRVTKSPKVYFTDTGLACHLLGLTAEGLASNRDLLGRLLENFILLELLKQSGCNDLRVELYHFRTRKGIEVDFVLEDSKRRVVGIEVKLNKLVRHEDCRGLNFLQDLAPRQFVRGVVLYSGDKVYPLGPKNWAVPISALWQPPLAQVRR